MQKKSVFLVLAFVFAAIGVGLFSAPTITGAAVSDIGIVAGTSFTLLAILLLVTASLDERIWTALEAIEQREQGDRPLCLVTGKNPISLERHKSPLYARVNSGNIDTIFQTPLAHKFGPDVYGAKAVVYNDVKGKFHVAFLTEAIHTHHRHAASIVARIADRVNYSENKKYLDESADALYEGKTDKAADLLSRSAGFELQYDRSSGEITGIQQDSWLTKEQRRTGVHIDLETEREMVHALLLAIEPARLSERLRNLDEEAIDKMYARRSA